MTVRELPRVEWKGKTYFWDMRLSQLRNVDDPNDFIDRPAKMEAKQVVKEKDGVRYVAMEWSVIEV